MSEITSRSNPKIKQVRALRQRKNRLAHGLFAVEGIHHVGEAFAAAQVSRISIDSIFYAPDLLRSSYANQLVRQMIEAGLLCYQTSNEVFASIADKENPQGILALVRYPHFNLFDRSPVDFPWGVGLISPQDPGNLGSILRSIDAVGASGLILLDSTLDPYHPGVVRASMGAVFWYPVITATFDDFYQWTHRYGYFVYGTSAKAELDYHEVQSFERPLILLMGSEREGLSADHISRCHQVLRVPMHGRVSSLNLSVAASIMLYYILEKSSPKYLANSS